MEHSNFRVCPSFQNSQRWRINKFLNKLKYLSSACHPALQYKRGHLRDILMKAIIAMQQYVTKVTLWHQSLGFQPGQDLTESGPLTKMSYFRSCQSVAKIRTGTSLIIGGKLLKCFWFACCDFMLLPAVLNALAILELFKLACVTVVLYFRVIFFLIGLYEPNSTLSKHTAASLQTFLSESIWRQD